MPDQAPSNWGRWGSNDERGTFNLLTNERVLSAFQLVKKGKIYSLAVPLEKDGAQNPMLEKTSLSPRIHTYSDGEAQAAVDLLTLVSHAGTHIDSLGHVWRGGHLYNGFPQEDAKPEGLKHLGIQNVRWMVGRGLMLDIPAYLKVPHLDPGQHVTVDDITSAAQAQGLEIRTGDIVLLRFGWYRVFQEDRALWQKAYPGPDDSLVPWLAENDLCALGSDTPMVEARSVVSHPPSPPLHKKAIRDLGLYLIENLDLEELARDKVYQFLFIGAPLRLVGASGAPWNPRAII